MLNMQDREGSLKMKVKVTIQSTELTKEDLRSLLQAIRDCEQSTFRDKKIFILVEVPDFTKDELAEILKSIKPPYSYGPVILKYSSKKT